MTGELIQFERRRDFRRGQLYRQQPIPRGQARAARNPSVVELQVARITRLLTELEELTRIPDDVPGNTLNLARASIDKARRIIGPWAETHLDDEIDGDPQPQLDDERLERMYRELSREY